MMPDVKLTLDQVRRIILAPQNRKQSVWTASSLLATQCRVHANTLKGEAVERFKPIRLRAARCLHSLWQEGVIYRQEATHDVGGWKEVKYVRPSDARGIYFVACERCGNARRSVNLPRGRVLEACPGCGLSGGQVREPGADSDSAVSSGHELSHYRRAS
jgi:hypothetical protein